MDLEAIGRSFFAALAKYEGALEAFTLAVTEIVKDEALDEEGKRKAIEEAVRMTIEALNKWSEQTDAAARKKEIKTLAVSLDSLRAIKKTGVRRRQGGTVAKGSKLVSARKATRALAPEGDLEGSIFDPAKLTQPQKKMFMALCGVAGAHLAEYKRAYAIALRGGFSPEEAAKALFSTELDVSFSELEYLYFGGDSKGNGTKNRSTIVRLINELSDYYYVYSDFDRYGHKELRKRRLIIPTGTYEKAGGKRVEGISLLLAPHMLRNNLTSMRLLPEQFRLLLTDICGKSQARTSTAVSLLTAAGNYQADEESPLRQFGLRTNLPSLAEVKKEDFSKLDRRAKHKLKKEVTETLDKLGAKDKYSLRAEEVTVSPAGLGSVASAYFPPQKSPKPKPQRRQNSEGSSAKKN